MFENDKKNLKNECINIMRAGVEYHATLNLVNFEIQNLILPVIYIYPRRKICPKNQQKTFNADISKL